MPIVIHELVITSKVGNKGQSNVRSERQTLSAKERELLVKECTEAVVKQLKQERQR